MKKVIVFLAEGFEEVEAMTPVDVLRRLGASVTIAGVGSQTVKGAHGVSVVCDEVAGEYTEPFDCVICPGGMPGAVNLASSWPVMQTLARTAAAGNLVCAICAAPAVVLGPAGLLEGHQAVCYPGMEAACPDFGFDREHRVVVSGNLITAKGPGCAEEFAFAIGRALFGPEAAQKAARDYQAGERK